MPRASVLRGAIAGSLGDQYFRDEPLLQTSRSASPVCICEATLNYSARGRAATFPKPEDFPLSALKEINCMSRKMWDTQKSDVLQFCYAILPSAKAASRSPSNTANEPKNFSTFLGVEATRS